MKILLRSCSLGLAPALTLALCTPVQAGDSQEKIFASGTANVATASVFQPEPLTYADLADLADSAPLVVRVQIRKVAPVEPTRANGLRPGQVRLYVEARTEALMAGRSGIGEAQRYLVDVPLDPRGKVPKLKKRSVVIFARAVAGRPGDLQLVAPDAQIDWTPAIDARLRAILGELTAPGAPQRVTAVREAIHVGGTLAGESETQLFLTTADGEPAAVTVSRAPGRAPRITTSFSEIVGVSGDAPVRDTLTWYRLACFLPPLLPMGANVSGSAVERAAAGADYRWLRDALGQCPRSRRP